MTRSLRNTIIDGYGQEPCGESSWSRASDRENLRRPDLDRQSQSKGLVWRSIVRRRSTPSDPMLGLSQAWGPLRNDPKVRARGRRFEATQDVLTYPLVIGAAVAAWAGTRCGPASRLPGPNRRGLSHVWHGSRQWRRDGCENESTVGTDGASGGPEPRQLQAGREGGP